MFPVASSLRDVHWEGTGMEDVWCKRLEGVHVEGVCVEGVHVEGACVEWVCGGGRRVCRKG